MDNTVTVLFAAGQTRAVAARPLYQWAYGQKLVFSGLDLPASYQVDFSNFEYAGTSIPQVGGAEGVTVPVGVLDTGRDVYAFVWIQDENAGRIEYCAEIPVIPCPEPDIEDPNPEEESAIAQAITALSAAVEQTGEDALKAEGYAVGTQDGEPVESGSPYYENSAEYMKDQAAQYALQADAFSGESAAWATGSYSGEGLPVPDSAPQHNNNAKYYAAQAQDAKDRAEAAADASERNLQDALITNTASGNPVRLTDAKNEALISLNADADCSVVITGKNLLSGAFSQASYANRADQTVIVGKGGYDYAFSSRVSLIAISASSMTFKVTASQISTTGIGIYVAVRPDTDYVLSYSSVSANKKVSIVYYDSDGVYKGNIKDAAEDGYTFTTYPDAAYVCVCFRCNAQNEEITYTNFQLEEGTTKSAYTAYQTKETVLIVSGTETDVSSVYSYFPVTNIYSLDDAEITVRYYCSAKAYVDAGDAALQAQIDALPTVPDIQANAFVSSYNVLDGWEPHAKAFAQMMYDVGEAEGFLFFTDTHFMAKQTESAWKEYAYAIFAYLEQLYYASPCSFVLHGGDWLGSGEAWSSIIYKLSTLGGIFRSRFNRYALLVGNHETGNQSEGNHTTTHGTLAATLLSDVGRTYYRFKANTFALFCFDTWVSGAIDTYSKEQIAWLANALLTETEPHIALAMHILYDNGNLKAFPEQLSLCAQAYNARSTYTYDGNTYDFSNCTGKVAFIIAGHTHADSTGTVNDIPYITTTNTTSYSETTFSNLPLPLDLIRVDWDTGKLTAYRAARGADGTTREITMVT